MTGIAELHAGALEATGRIVRGVAADRWHASTPCPGWDARALVNHFVSGNLWAAELAAGGTIETAGSRLDGDVLGLDPARLRPGACSIEQASKGAPVSGESQSHQEPIMAQRQDTILKKCPCANQECCSHKWTLRYRADGIAQRLYHVIVEDLEEGASALRG